MRAPTRITIPTRRKTKVGLSVRIVPRPAGETFLPASEPATARTKRIGRKRAPIITDAAEQVGEADPVGAGVAGGVGLDEAGVAGPGGAVVVGLGEVGVEGLREALRVDAGVDRALAELGRRGEPGGEQHHQRRHQHPERDQLDLPRADLLAEVLGGAADHQAADEDGEDDVEQHRVEAGADAAEDHLAEAEVGERHRAAEPGQRLEGAS